jgi:Flp pilus assembly CpaE family ATPase
VPSVSGLRILFGPDTAAECEKIDSSYALEIIDELASEAEFVVLDLPNWLDSVNRAILGASEYLTLVLEPMPTCINMGKTILAGIQALDKAPASSGAVIVKRLPEGPLNIPELEAELGVPVLRVIPPAREVCLVSEQAHIPILQADPDSLAAESLLALARVFHARNGHLKVTHTWDIDYRGSLSGA